MIEPTKSIEQALNEYFRSEAGAIGDAGFSMSVNRLVTKQQQRRTRLLVFAVVLASTVATTAVSSFVGVEVLVEQFDLWFGDWPGTVYGLCAILALAASIEACSPTASPG